MALRCLLFSEDGGTAEPICQVLAGLEVEGESCSDAVVAVDKVTHQAFQIVIIDWDKQPEAALLLKASRERKAAERPLTLAIVSDDASVPKALQAGANSILRKPIMVNQAKDTLTTARDLLRAKQESATNTAQAAAAGASASSTSTLPASMEAGKEKTLRAGEFLQSAPVAPGGQFVTESDRSDSSGQAVAEPVDQLRDLEPVAASVAEEKPVAPPPPPSSEPRGLEWYLKTRGGTLPPIPARTPAPQAPAKPELLGYDQTPSQPPLTPVTFGEASAAVVPEATPDQVRHEQKREAQLFAYMSGDEEKPRQPRAAFRLGKRAIIAASVLAACAIVAAPQAPWHPMAKVAWARGQQRLHGWLNPQPVTTAPAPVAHEDFGRAGDEYKLPVAENIPDATTDPSQIQVVPVIDPTKKPNADDPNAGQPTGPIDGTAATPTDQSPADPPQVHENPQLTPETVPPATGPAATGTLSSPASTATAPAAVPPHSDSPAVITPSPSSVSPPVARPLPPTHSQPHAASTPSNVPSSLKSQMVSMTPEASGNKPVESAMASIEPVAVPELTQRALLIEQPPLLYPANARGQQGRVVLQVLIGRDGTVQDAKFLQGSLAFARAAIDGVKQWKFRPYTMNGRPVSVQTQITMAFKPGS